MILQANCQNLATLGWKSAKCCQTLAKLCQHFKEKIMISNVCANVESGAVRKSVNIVDLKRCCKMSMYLQKSASIQPRTSSQKYHSYIFSSLRFWSTNILQQGPYFAPCELCLFITKREKKAERLSSPIEISPNGLKKRAISHQSQYSVKCDSFSTWQYQFSIVITDGRLKFLPNYRDSYKTPKLSVIWRLT